MNTELTQRDKTLQRVINLRAKAANEASSEAEMNTAFTVAMKLMDAYNIEEAELVLAENTGRIKLDIVQKVADADALIRKSKHKITLCLRAIADFTSTRVVLSTITGNITYTGHRPDTELASYLTAVIKKALDLEYNAYYDRTPNSGYGAKASFQIAMSYRISDRLSKMKKEQETEQNEECRRASLQIEDDAIRSSTALIVKKIAEEKRDRVEEAFLKAYPKLRKTSGFSVSKNSTAHSAGSDAGNRVNLGRAINAGSTRKIT